VSSMTVSELAFPVLAFSKYGLESKSSAEELRVEFKAALDDGIFANLPMVDASGRTFRVVDTKILGGAGPLWGFSLLYSRRLRIELELGLAENQMTLEEGRGRVLKNFRSWHGWESRDDFDDLREAVSRAESIREIAEILAVPAATPG